MNIGDQIIVINNGFTYDSYDTFFNENNLSEYIPFWKLKGVPVEGNIYTIVAKGYHRRHGKELTVIQDIQTEQVYIVSLTVDRTDYFTQTIDAEMFYSSLFEKEIIE